MAVYEFVIKAGELDITREDDRTRLDALADKAGDELGLPEEFAAAYRPGSDELYVYPGMNPAFSQHLTSCKLTTLDELASRRHKADNHNFYEPYLNDVLAKVPPKNRPALIDYTRKAIILNIDEVEDGVFNRTAARNTREAGMGPLASPLLSAISTADMVHFHQPQAGGGDTVVGDAMRFWPFVDYAYGGGASPDITLDDLTRRLQARPDHDLSQAMLDRRFEQFTAILHVELANLYLRNATDLVAFTLRNKAMLQIWKRHRDSIMQTNDIDERLGMFSDLAGVTEMAASAEKHVRLRQSVTDMAFSSRQTVVVTDQLLRSYAALYGQLGYRLHPVLTDRYLQGAAGGSEVINVRPVPPAGAVAVKETVAVEAAAPETDDAQSLAARGAELDEACRALNEGWSLRSRSEREELGLRGSKHSDDGIYEALVFGHNDHMGQPLINGMSKQDATRMADTLYMLVGLPDAEALAAELERHRTLAADCQAHTQAVRDRRQDPPHFDLIPLDQLVATIRTNQAGFLHLIRNRWPAASWELAVEQFQRVMADDAS